MAAKKGNFSEIRDEAVYKEALKLCKGSYQEDILNGSEALSGSTLKGKALNYKGKYQESSSNLLTRCHYAGLDVREEIQAHGKRVVVVG